MRFVLYNICYATGPKLHQLLGVTGKNLRRIEGFLRDLQPDLVGLVEVDYGSFRSGRKNQVELLAESLGTYHSYSMKYGEGSLWRRVPVFNRQGNAILARDRIRNETFHYFNSGMKRLVIELELDHVVVYLVHLSLGARTRQQQIAALFNLVKRTSKPCIVAGDFNAFWGEQEIDLFLAATGLQSANIEELPTFPSHRPTRHLDFILHSPQIEIVDFQIPRVTYSDHLPLVFDFNVNVGVDLRKQDRAAHCFSSLSETLAGVFPGPVVSP
jgi:endonuclease/exonuclease/phosphatase family metal-dependent hydrolase